MSHPKRTTDRGRMDAKGAITLVTALFVAGLIASVLLPVAIGELVGTSETSFSAVSEGSEVSVTSTLNATLDNVNQSNSDITVTVSDTDTGSSTAFTNVTASTTNQLEGEDITVTLDSVDSATTASFTVEYPRYYNFGSGAQSIWKILDLIIVLAVLLFLLGMALFRSGRI